LASDLPVLAAREEILSAVSRHPVTIVCGETGSGKTTQLPQLCLLLERGVEGLIGCTQPRRVAARSVAQRLAQELGTRLGEAVGYQVRFHDQVSDRSFIKVMTEGILLAEIAHDPELRRYDTLILDEVHERSLNMDFLMGYLKCLLPRRPELKVVLTSATLEAERLSTHFGQAPVIEVSGRTWPVEIRWRPIEAPTEEETDDEDRALQALLNAVDELGDLHARGDILIFLPGERDIRKTAEALRKHHPPHTEILPLYARQSQAEQDRVFQAGTGRRIVLSTNVAETSLTVPGIHFVIDTGLARVNRYSLRTKVTQLRVEKISQAAARQRAGRCGRVAAGICIRLYGEVDFAARPPFTTPEILRTSLASVILRLAHLGLGSLDTLPLLDSPTPRAIEEGYRLLHELGAMDETRILTQLGRELAPLPLDPRLGRMVLAARDLGCLREILVLVAALSVQDPRMRPSDDRSRADAHHAQFLQTGSEFQALLQIWDKVQEAFRHRKSGRQLVHFCQRNYLSPARVREWRELHGQLAGLMAERQWLPNESPAPPESIHRALLGGLLGQIGQWDREAQNYLGPRGIRFRITSGGRGKERPRWVMAAELAETEGIQARLVAPLQPEWIEVAAGPLVQRSYGDPYWDPQGEQVNAYEKVTLYGLTLVARRPVRYGPIAPHEARRVFIQHGLVAGELKKPPPFLVHNLATMAEVLALEHKGRRQGVLIPEEDLCAFYEDCLPLEVWSAQRLNHWLRERTPGNPDPLLMTREFLMRHAAGDITEIQFPDHFSWGGQDWPLTYRFEPGHPLDGVTLTLPLPVLSLMDNAPLDWLVPGLIREKITYLLKKLPGTLRRALVPLPPTVTAFLERHGPVRGALLPQLSHFVRQRSGQAVSPEDWPSPPEHLKMRLLLTDEAGQEIASGRDLDLLRAQWNNPLLRTLSSEKEPDWVRKGLTRWDFEELSGPRTLVRAGIVLTVYPGLVDRGQTVDLVAFDDQGEALAGTREGIRRLAHLSLAPLRLKGSNTLPDLLPLLPEFARLAKNGDPVTADTLFDLLLQQVLRQWLPDEGVPPHTRTEFQHRLQTLKGSLGQSLKTQVALFHDIFTRHRNVVQRLAQLSRQPDLAGPLNELEHRRQCLMNFTTLRTTPPAKLANFPRYLHAMEIRLEKLPRDLAGDIRKNTDLMRLERRWADTLRRRGPSPALEEFRWLLEELHCALFAQSLKTPHPVSVPRLEKFWENHGKSG
jgi:ATP-dependent helicase HrpA